MWSPDDIKPSQERMYITEQFNGSPLSTWIELEDLVQLIFEPKHINRIDVSDVFNDATVRRELLKPYIDPKHINDTLKRLKNISLYDLSEDVVKNAVLTVQSHKDNRQRRIDEIKKRVRAGRKPVSFEGNIDAIIKVASL